MNPVDEFTSIFTQEKLADVIQMKRNFFQVSPAILAMKQKIPIEPFAAGLFLGAGNPLQPSASMLDWVGERTDKIAVLDKKASWLFLCGRDIFPESVTKTNVSQGLVIIKNDLNEVLGMGMYPTSKLSDFKKKRMAKDHIQIRNIFDKGDFIRREKH